MSDLAKASEEAVGWALLLGAVKAQAEAARTRLLEAMEGAGSLKQGVPNWGTVTLTGGGDAAEVYDLHALTAWTAIHRPEMMEQVARPAWIRLLLEIAKTEGQAVDPETGAIVPGVRRVTRPHGLLVKTERAAQDGARALVQAMAVGSLAITPEGHDGGSHP